MRNRHPVAQAGGAQALTGKQTVGDQGARQAVQTLKQQTCFFKGAFFAGGFNAHENLSGRQNGSKSVHSGWMAAMMPPGISPLAGQGGGWEIAKKCCTAN